MARKAPNFVGASGVLPDFAPACGLRDRKSQHPGTTAAGLSEPTPQAPRFGICPAGKSATFPLVEWIAQAALGAALGELLLGRRLGNRALAWGALFGLLPGLDVLAYPLLREARELWWHRGPSHSLPVLAAISYAAACGLERLWKREKIGRAEAWTAVFVILAAHVLLDCLGVRGAAVLWPLPGRVALDLLPATDFALAAPLVITTLRTAFLPPAAAKKSRSKKPPPPSKRRRLCWWGIGLAAGYVLLAIGMKSLVRRDFQADLARRGVTAGRRMEAPTPYNILLWRAVADRGDDFWVGYRSVFDPREIPVRWTIYPKRAAALAKVADLRETKILTTLADGWWLARPDVRGAWLGDLRQCEARTWDTRKGRVDSRLIRAWIVAAGAKREPLLRVTPTSGEDFAKRLARRIFGNREEWEANPRLAGVPGSLPEALEVRE